MARRTHRNRPSRLGATNDAHVQRFETALEELYGALEEADRAATCRRRMAALGRAYREWGHLTSEHLSATDTRLGHDRDAASDALLEARQVFESVCLRNREY